jgi:hypothetical protein
MFSQGLSERTLRELKKKVLCNIAEDLFYLTYPKGFSNKMSGRKDIELSKLTQATSDKMIMSCNI